MAFWIALWKVVFVVVLAGFSLLSVWVTVQGARDIGSLLRTLADRHEQDS